MLIDRNPTDTAALFCLSTPNVSRIVPEYRFTHCIPGPFFHSADMMSSDCDIYVIQSLCGRPARTRGPHTRRRTGPRTTIQQQTFGDGKAECAADYRPCDTYIHRPVFRISRTSAEDVAHTLCRPQLQCYFRMHRILAAAMA